jgi:hypothetical protein
LTSVLKRFDKVNINNGADPLARACLAGKRAHPELKEDTMRRTSGQFVRLFILLSLFLGLSPAGAGAQTPGDPPDIVVALYGKGFASPVHITHAGDGTGRLFVVEQPGRVRIIKDGSSLAVPFLDISTRISCCGERGLLSAAFPPGNAMSRPGAPFPVTFITDPTAFDAL